MKYVIIEENRNGNGDMFTTETEDLETAISHVVYEWYRTTYRERKKKTVYLLESETPDVEAPNHYDGKIIWKDGEFIR